MSVLFAYVCTRSTVDPYIPKGATGMQTLARDVSDGFAALSGGYSIVGKMAFFPVQRSVPNHLLCDGREVAKASFPELYDLIGDSQGTPSDADHFVLPNFVNTALATTTTAATETAGAATVSTPDPSPPAPGDPPVYRPYGDVESGGRQPHVNGPIP